MWRAILTGFLVVAVFGVLRANAEHTRFWQQSSYEEFEKGTRKGVALRSDGTLAPAPSFAPFADPNLAYVWALAVDSHGRLFAAGGSNAKVLRLDASGKVTSVFESPELEAQALAVDAHDNVYVGTSPDGKVYKITPEGQHSVFFEPKAKYIWALAFDREGFLYVATGDKGEVYVVGQDGKGSLFYKSEESHARSLAFDTHGNLLVGTDPSGLIIRVGITRKKGELPAAGKAFVIYQTAKKEVTALAVDVQGNLYAAAVGNKAGTLPIFPLVTPQTPMISPATIAAAQAGQAATITPALRPNVPPFPVLFPTLPGAAGGSEVYRIAPDGSPESLWSSPADVVYALGFSSTGRLLLGTGNQGQVIELGDDHVFSSLASAESSQVTSLVAEPNGKVFVATANPGKVFTLGPGYANEGTFESQAFDAKIYSQWGKLTWWGKNGATGGRVELYVRSGNTSDPDNYWSPWTGPYTNAAGESVTCPAARFVQWKAAFRNVGEKVQPTLDWVKLAYLRKNVAPEIDGIVVEKPGVRAQGFAMPAAGPMTPPSAVPLRLPESPVAGAVGFSNLAATAQQHPTTLTVPPQGFAAKGYETVVWSAHDDNDDHLVFTLYYRGEGEKEWRILKDKIRQDFYSWDTTSMPDGAYYLKLVASDAPSNPPKQALTAERISDRFEVDNTPPVIENLRAEGASGQWRIRFTAHDSASAIGHTSYSLDAGDWEMVFPVGQLTDSPEEHYDFVLAKLAPGEHTIAVQVFDEFQNSVTGKVTFTVPSPAR